jgi:hypothetical protein
MTLTDFLIELASSPKLSAKFKKDPKKVMKKAGLSKADRKLLLSGDPQGVRAAVDTEKLGDQIVTIVFISVLLNGGK